MDNTDEPFNWVAHRRRAFAYALMGTIFRVASVILTGYLGPRWLFNVAVLLVSAEALRVAWQITPGRCYRCRRRTGIGVDYLDGQHPQRPSWIDIFHPHIDQPSLYACPDHLLELYQARVRAERSPS